MKSLGKLSYALCAVTALVFGQNIEATTYQSSVLSDAPVSYWTFDEAGTGQGAALDTAPLGTATSGTFFGAGTRRTSGLVGAGASMHPDANGNGVNVGTIDLSHTSITVEALITTNWTGVDQAEIFRKEDGGNRILLSFQSSANMGGGGSGGAPIGTAGNPGIAFGINIPGGGGYGELDVRFDGLAGRPSLTDVRNGVHHVAATYDQLTGTRSIYWNGVLIGSVANGAGNAMVSGGGTAGVIGNDSGGNFEPFSGVIDEVAIYNKGLSAAAVANHASKRFDLERSVMLSSEVIGPGNFNDGYTNGGTVDLVRFIPNSASDPLNVTYNQGGDTIDFSNFATTGATAGNLGSNIHGRGSVLFLPGDGETAASNNGGLGLGAHANWLVTFDLDDIRDGHLGGFNGLLRLEGRFGMNGQGSPGEIVSAAGEVQGLIYLDGILIDSSPLQTILMSSHLIDLNIETGAKFLTLAIVNGTGNGTTFDDGSFRDIRLTAVVVPEPASLTLLGLAGVAMMRRRRVA